MDDGSRLPLILTSTVTEVDSSMITPWLAAIALLLCAVYFAVTETSLASASRNKIKTAAERGEARAKNVLYLMDNFDRAISTILIGTNIVHLSIASIVTVTVTKLWGISWVSLSTIVTTIIVFFAGEMLPKSIAKKYPERFSKLCAGPMIFFMKLFGPLSAMLTAIGQFAARLAHGEAEASVTEDEIYDIIEDMTEEGTLNEEQGDLISSALQFGDVTVESVLTPRVDVAAIDVASRHEDILAYIKDQPHSRLPVYDGSIDNIIGILQIRKFIKSYLRQGNNLDIRPMLDEAYFVHHSTNIDELLPIMSHKKMNMAIVTDNYGGTLGIVTVEDILEELVGEIWDEEDEVEEPITLLPDGSYDVDAEESVTDVLELFGIDAPDEDEDSLINTLMGEWAYEQFTGIPGEGESFTYNNLRVTVAQMQHNRILKLNVALLANEEGGDEA